MTSETVAEFTSPFANPLVGIHRSTLDYFDDVSRSADIKDSKYLQNKLLLYFLSYSFVQLIRGNPVISTFTMPNCDFSILTTICLTYRAKHYARGKSCYKAISDSVFTITSIIFPTADRLVFQSLPSFWYHY